MTNQLLSKKLINKLTKISFVVFTLVISEISSYAAIDPGLIDQEIENLSSDSMAKVLTAIQLLRQVDDGRVLIPLIQTYETTKERAVKLAVIEALGRLMTVTGISYRQILPFLKKRIFDSDKTIANQAILLFQKTQKPFKKILVMLLSRQESIQLSAISNLKRLGGIAYSAELDLINRIKIKSTSEHVRSAAKNALDQIRSNRPTDHDSIIQDLNSTDREKQYMSVVSVNSIIHYYGELSDDASKPTGLKNNTFENLEELLIYKGPMRAFMMKKTVYGKRLNESLKFYEVLLDHDDFKKIQQELFEKFEQIITSPDVKIRFSVKESFRVLLGVYYLDDIKTDLLNTILLQLNEEVEDSKRVYWLDVYGLIPNLDRNSLCLTYYASQYLLAIGTQVPIEPMKGTAFRHLKNAVKRANDPKSCRFMSSEYTCCAEIKALVKDVKLD